MKQVSLTTAKCSSALTGPRFTSIDNESTFGGWSLPSPLWCFCYKRAKPDGSDKMAKLGAKIWDRGMFSPTEIFYTLPKLQKSAFTQSLQITDPKRPWAKADFELKVEMDSEHLLWRPQITPLLIKPWSERMPETHGKVLPLWPSHHNIWKQEDSEHFRRGLKSG